MKIINPLIFAILISACSGQFGSKSELNKKKSTFFLSNELSLLLPTKSFLPEEDSSMYSGLQVFLNDKPIYEDGSLIFYLYKNPYWPQFNKLLHGRSQLIIRTVGAPDFDKLLVLTFDKKKLLSAQELPVFEQPCKDVDGDGLAECWGIMSAIEGLGSEDSCYYNPTLFYQIDSSGMVMDTMLTKTSNEKKWGKFYGFKQLYKSVKCPN